MKIAITQRVIDYKNGPYDSLDHGFYSMFKDHELIPIPNKIKHFRSSVVTDADLIVFSGGNSMIKDDWQYNHERLRVEKHVLDLALAYDKKILGLSRGAQFLTVSLGGSLKPHSKHKEDHPVMARGHKITVRSRHNEVLGSIPTGATALAKDSEGYVESWILQDKIGCVLWHPERMNNHWIPEELHWYK